jgi:hypothetical protein
MLGLQYNAAVAAQPFEGCRELAVASAFRRTSSGPAACPEARRGEAGRHRRRESAYATC